MDTEKELMKFKKTCKVLQDEHIKRKYACNYWCI